MLTPEQKKQQLDDESTTFVLAGCAVTLYQLMMAKNLPGTAKMLTQIGILLARDPDYLKRFEVAQKAVMDEFNLIHAPKPKLIVP